MCGRYSLFCSPGQLKTEFNLTGLPDFQKMYNMPPGEKCPVVGENPTTGERSAPLLEWGIKASWQDNSNSIINARRETLAEKPIFQKLLSHRRCLVPASGFYEWKENDGNKQPYWLYPKGKEVVGFAGLWREDSFVIITGPAAGELKTIHDRMPVVVGENRYKDWLDPENNDLSSLEKILDEENRTEIKNHPVTKKVNNPGYDCPEAVKPRD
ncbi:MAG: SOS response-associated peptidase [bacterium]